jgi:hypothetical protein
MKPKMITTIRNIEAKAQVTGQGVTEGQTYTIIKCNIKEVSLGVRSSAWVRCRDGSTLTVQNAHIMFGLQIA